MRRRQDTSKWDEIGDDLTDLAFAKLGLGDILRFKQDGRVIDMKIMRMNKKKRKCFVQQVRTYTPDEVEAMSKGIGK